jgi:hypothetical protein
MNGTSAHWVYEVWEPKRCEWMVVRKLKSPREIGWRFGSVDFALGDGRNGTGGRFRETVVGEVVDVTEYVRQRDAMSERVEQIGSDFEYQVVSAALGKSADRYFLTVEYRLSNHWRLVERTRDGFPRGYKTLRSALNALWKHRSAKSGQWPARYALFDLQSARVIGEYIIEIAEYLGFTRANLRRKANVAMLELALV